MSEPVLEPILTELFGRPAPAVELVKLKGDASSRQYYRIQLPESASGVPASLIVMQLPAELNRSDEGGEQPAPERLPFLEVGELLAERRIPVPKVFGEDLENGILLLEDLGDQTLYAALAETPKPAWVEHYGRAVDLMAEVHERCADLPKSSLVRRRSFDRALLEWELDHFRRWGLEALFGERSDAERGVLERAFCQIVDAIAGMPRGFVHRDFQSKNLMVSPAGDLTLIDFQDALVGPRAYDLVALLCDSYVPLEPDLQDAMIARYAALRRIPVNDIEREFRWITLHRKLKDAGRFVFIDRVRNNPDFLEWFAPSLVYVGRALEQIRSLSDLEHVLRTAIPGFPAAVEKPRSESE